MSRQKKKSKVQTLTYITLTIVAYRDGWVQMVRGADSCG